MSQDSLGDILTGDTFLSDSVHNVPHPVTAGVRTERRVHGAQPEGGEGRGVLQEGARAGVHPGSTYMKIIRSVSRHIAQLVSIYSTVPSLIGNEPPTSFLILLCFPLDRNSSPGKFYKVPWTEILLRGSINLRGGHTCQG